MSVSFGNGGGKRLATVLVSVVLLGPGLVAGTRFLPRLMDIDRRQAIEKLRAKRDELRRRLEQEPSPHRLSETVLIARWKRFKHGQTVLLVQDPTLPQPVSVQ